MGMISTLVEMTKWIGDALAPTEVARVTEPPLGLLSRVHELMWNEEARESIRVGWQLTETEMGEMSKIFGEIAVLHDIQRPEKIRNVLDKRKKGMRDVLWRDLFAVIHNVRKRNSRNKLSPMPPDNGGAFGDDVEKVVNIIDKPGGDESITSAITEMVKHQVRKVYSEQQKRAREHLDGQVFLPIENLFQLRNAWAIVRDAVKAPPVDGETLTKLEQALRLIGESQQPKWETRQIEYELKYNMNAILSPDISKEAGSIQQLKSRILEELDKKPDDIDTTVNKAIQLADRYVDVNNLGDFLREGDYRSAVVNQITRSEGVKPGSLLYNRLITEIEGATVQRLDQQIREYLVETGLRDKLVPFVNDPPNRREALLKWQEFAKRILNGRLVEVRLAPTRELLARYKNEDRELEELKNNRPELWESIQRIRDMHNEAGVALPSEIAEIVG